jgi:hypothetical protein
VAFAHALIDGRSVTEFEPNGKAARELVMRIPTKAATDSNLIAATVPT